MNSKTNKLSNSLDSIADAALIISEANRFYYTGFPATDGFLLVTKSRALFFTDSRYTEAAEKCIGSEFVRNSATVFEQIKEIFSAENIKTVAVENDRITLAQFENLKNELPCAEFISTSALTDIIEAQRSVKDESEVQLILKAQSIAEAAFDHILGFIKPGLTEKDVQLELDYFMLKNGAEGLSFETIAVSGVNSSMPHGVPSNKKIETGDFITLDYGALYKGYHSDMTRTVAVGKASEKQKSIYSTVLEAQIAALEAFKDGVTCFDADKAARDIITKAGYGECFGHGTGHGVGVEIHEFPSVSKRSKATLKAGNIVTSEPGIYIPGEFGVRIEDMALITENGCRNLTNCPKELIII
ncbi:MAG: aminopeptidase P family protein [Oscillospiraceae bacterium]|nr:aminopeptidase P family protein [Oscillospiraceae bacterium]